MRKDLYERKNEILMWIDMNYSIHQMSRLLCCNLKTLKSFLIKEKIEYAGNRGLKGLKKDPKRKTYAELIEQIKKGKSISNSRLRNRILEDGIKECRCEMCGATEWFGKPILLELHHKDFNHHNTDFDNLQILCSNCHSYIHKYNIKNY